MKSCSRDSDQPSPCSNRLCPHGYGHAVLCGRDFVAGEPFLLQVSDHLYVSDGKASCTRQLLDVAGAQGCSVSAVQATPERLLRYYGTVAGSLVPGREGLYVVENVMEKPTPTVAEQSCVVPGLRNGHYLCFFGMHVLTPAHIRAACRRGGTARRTPSSGCRRHWPGSRRGKNTWPPS